MSIRVDLVVGRRGEDNKEVEGERSQGVVDEEENEVTDDASDADSGVDPGQDEQVNFKIRFLDETIISRSSSRRGRSPSVASVSSPLNSTTAWTGDQQSFQHIQI